MDPAIFKVAAQIAGIGGIALVVFLLLNREVLRRNLFSSLTKQQSYHIIRLILISCFLVSMSGIGAWVFIEHQARRPAPEAEVTARLSWNKLREIYIDSFDVPNTGVKDIWSPFREDIWSGGISDGKYRLSNASDGGSSQYIWVEVMDPSNAQIDTSNLPVSVDVGFAESTNNTTRSALGLIYRFDQRSRYYYAFCVNREGVFTFYRRDADGLNTVSADRFQLRNGENRIAVIGQGEQIHLYINEAPVKVVQDSALKRGITGVIALTTGEFRFDNFTVYAAPQSLPQ